MAWLTNKTWTAGRLLATDLNTYVRDQLNHIGGAWDPYTPALTASTTNPNLGATGSATGAHKIVGKTCDWRASFIWFGSGATAGDGTFAVSLPGTPAGTYPIIGSGWAYFGGSWINLVLDPAGGSTARMIATGIGAIGSAQAPSSGAVLAVGGRMELA